MVKEGPRENAEREDDYDRVFSTRPQSPKGGGSRATYDFPKGLLKTFIPLAKEKRFRPEPDGGKRKGVNPNSGERKKTARISSAEEVPETSNILKSEGGERSSPRISKAEKGNKIDCTSQLKRENRRAKNLTKTEPNRPNASRLNPRQETTRRAGRQVKVSQKGCEFKMNDPSFRRPEQGGRGRENRNIMEMATKKIKGVMPERKDPNLILENNTKVMRGNKGICCLFQRMEELEKERGCPGYVIAMRGEAGRGRKGLGVMVNLSYVGQTWAARNGETIKAGGERP